MKEKTKRNPVGRVFASYYESEIIENEVRRRMNDLFFYEGETEDEIRYKVTSDPYFLQDAFDDFCEELGSYAFRKLKTLCAKVEGFNLNWRNASGVKYVCYDYATNEHELGQAILRDIVPNTSEYSVRCNHWKKGMLITVFHHDCPMGSMFYFSPCALSTFERYVLNG